MNHRNAFNDDDDDDNDVRNREKLLQAPARLGGTFLFPSSIGKNTNLLISIMLVFVANEQLYPCTEVLLYVITELQLLALQPGGATRWPARGRRTALFCIHW